jgi:hypothetical protein
MYQIQAVKCSFQLCRVFLILSGVFRATISPVLIAQTGANVNNDNKLLSLSPRVKCLSSCRNPRVFKHPNKTTVFDVVFV